VQRVFKIIDRLSLWTGIAAAWSLLALVAVVAFAVITRKIVGIGGALSYDLIYMLWGFCLVMAAARTQLEKGHVNIDILINRFSARTRAILDLVFYFLLCFPVVFVFIKWGTDSAWSATKLLEKVTSPSALPLYPLRWTIPIGCFFLLLQCIATWVRNLLFLLKGEGQ